MNISLQETQLILAQNSGIVVYDSGLVKAEKQ